jgi:hypothetical protein
VQTEILQRADPLHSKNVTEWLMIDRPYPQQLKNKVMMMICIEAVSVAVAQLRLLV